MIIQYLQEEGFDATYLPYGNGGKAYKDELKHLADDLELGENYAVVGKSSCAFSSGLNCDADKRTYQPTETQQQPASMSISSRNLIWLH